MVLQQVEDEDTGTDAAAPRDGAAVLVAAGLEVIADRGYAGASIRDIARHAGMSTANLYHHFSSKEELLHRMMVEGIDELLADTATALERAPSDPRSRLEAIVHVHVVTHARRGVVASVSASEIRHLRPEHQEDMRARMGRQQRFWDDAVLDGVAAGVFEVERPRDSARALASMCTAVATWFNPQGPLSPEALAEHYVGLVLAALRATP